MSLAFGVLIASEVSLVFRVLRLLNVMMIMVVVLVAEGTEYACEVGYFSVVEHDC